MFDAADPALYEAIPQEDIARMKKK